MPTVHATCCSYSQRRGDRKWLKCVAVALLVSCLSPLLTPVSALIDASTDHPDVLRSRCTLAAPRLMTNAEKERLCDLTAFDAGIDPTLPSKCAALALAERASQVTPTKRDQERIMPHVLSLCSGARDLGPARCWLKFPPHKRLHIASSFPSPFVDVCRSALDSGPAECFLQWLQLSSLLPKRDADNSLSNVTAVCRRQTAPADAFAACVKQTAHAVGSTLAFSLCQFVSDTSRRPVVECAMKLARKRLPPTAIADGCARATALVSTEEIAAIRPEVCMVAAQKQLGMWMDAAIFGILCDRAPAGTTTPVECASELRDFERRILAPTPTSNHMTAQFRRRRTSELVARLCRLTTNGTAVAACVQLLPPQLLSADHIIRLCGSRGATPVTAARLQTDMSTFPARCVTRAKTLMRFWSFDASDGAQLTLPEALTRLCEGAESLAPSDCLAAAQYNRQLSPSLRISLCRHAISDAPTQCLRRLKSHLTSRRLTVDDAVKLCGSTDAHRNTIHAADCASAVLRDEMLGLVPAITSTFVARLCHQATSTAPAACYRAAPPGTAAVDRVSLCHHAESIDPAKCASLRITRMTSNDLLELCRHAASGAPGSCALEAPFGMPSKDIASLCAQATSTQPAACARTVSLTLRVPWTTVARVCTEASSTIPAQCINHELLRHRVPITASLIRDCRAAIAKLAGLEIARVAYACDELQPHCPLSLVVHGVSQFGGDMPALSDGYVQLAADLESQDGDASDSSEQWISGHTVAPFVNGSAKFADLQFTAAGRFVLRFRMLPDGPETVARIRIHRDVVAEDYAQRCDSLFAKFQCFEATEESDDDLQFLALASGFIMTAIDCEQRWAANAGGFALVGTTAHGYRVYALPRAVYDFLTYVRRLIHSHSCTHSVVIEPAM